MKNLLVTLFSAKAKKALGAGFAAFVGSVGVACSDGNVDGKELVVALGAGLLALAAAFGFKNAPAA